MLLLQPCIYNILGVRGRSINLAIPISHITGNNTDPHGHLGEDRSILGDPREISRQLLDRF